MTKSARMVCGAFVIVGADALGAPQTDFPPHTMPSTVLCLALPKGELAKIFDF